MIYLFFSLCLIFSDSGSTKKRNNHIQSVKVIKVNGSVLSLAICQNTRHVAIGNDHGDVSLFSFDS